MSAHSAPHVCFLGCGTATRTHAQLLARSRLRGNVPVRLSFASRSPSRAAQYTAEFRGESAFGTYDHAIEHPGVDLIVIATPPALHRTTAERAIGAGKAVALEKPAFPTAADALYISRLAEVDEVPVFVLENYAYKPLLRRLQQVLAAGWIGSPRFVRVDALKRQSVVGWRADPALAGGGALLEGGIHWVSLMARLGPAVKSARVIHAGGGEATLSSLLVLDYHGGAVGTLHYSWETPGMLGPLRRSRIDGTRGSITFESNGLLTVVNGTRRRIYGPSRDLLGFRAMWADVLGALRERRDPRYTLEDAREDLALLESSMGARARAAGGGWETGHVGQPRSPLRGCGVQV